MNKQARMMIVNAEAASAPDAHTHEVVLRAFKVAEANNVDVIYWCEVGDVDVEIIGKIVDPRFHTQQYGKSKADDPEAGCALSFWKDTGQMTNFRRRVGSAKTSEGSHVTGSGIRERSIVSAIFQLLGAWKAPVNALHAPPSRARRARLAYMLKVLALPGFAAGDTNFLKSALMRFAARRGRTVVSVGVLAIFIPRRFWVSKPQKFNVGSDHQAFIVTVEPKKARKARKKEK